MRVHTGERNFICNVCGKRFAERYNLVSHQKLHEASNSKTLDLRCEVCERNFDKKSKLEEHMATGHPKFNEVAVDDFQNLINGENNLWTHISNDMIKSQLSNSYMLSNVQLGTT